jgi:hypothetical protein
VDWGYPVGVIASVSFIGAFRFLKAGKSLIPSLYSPYRHAAVRSGQVRSGQVRSGQASRADIDKLLVDKLSDALTPEQKQRKIGNLLTKLRRSRQIHNEGSKKVPIWRLAE